MGGRWDVLNGSQAAAAAASALAPMMPNAPHTHPRPASAPRRNDTVACPRVIDPLVQYGVNATGGRCQFVPDNLLYSCSNLRLHVSEWPAMMHGLCLLAAGCAPVGGASARGVCCTAGGMSPAAADCMHERAPQPRCCHTLYHCPCLAPSPRPLLLMRCGWGVAGQGQQPMHRQHQRQPTYPAPSLAVPPSHPCSHPPPPRARTGHAHRVDYAGPGPA